MAQTLSLAIVIGNLGADPEIRTGQDGHRVALFRLATDSHRTDTDTGRRVPQTVWHRIVCHNDFLTDLLERRARKGQLVFVRGAYEVRPGTDQGPPEPEIVVSAQDGDVRILTDTGRGRPLSSKNARNPALEPVFLYPLPDRGGSQEVLCSMRRPLPSQSLAVRRAP